MRALGTNWQPWHWAILLGLGVRIVWVALLGGTPILDAQSYFEGAQQLASHFEYTYHGEATAYWPVGYPAALAACLLVLGSKVSSAWVLNLIAGVGSLFCLHRVASRLGFSARVATCAVWLAAFDPIYIAYSSLAVSETWFVFLMLLGTLLALEPAAARARLVLSGAVFGWAALTRPQGLLLPWLVAIAAPPAAGARVGGRLLPMALGLALVLAPWCIRNAVELRGFVPLSTNSGINLFIGNNPHAIGRYRLDDEVMAPLQRFMPDRFMGGPKEVAFDRLTQRLAFQHIGTHPLETLAQWPSKLLFTYLPDLTALGWNTQPESALRLRVLGMMSLPIAIHHIALLVLAAIGFTRARKALRARAASEHDAQGATDPPHTRALRVPLAIVGAFTLVSLVYFGMPRFHVPMLPWFELLAAIVIARGDPFEVS